MAAEYICTACGGKVTEAEYTAGKTTCQTYGCSKNGQPFERREASMPSAPAAEVPKKKPFWKFW